MRKNGGDLSNCLFLILSTTNKKDWSRHAFPDTSRAEVIRFPRLPSSAAYAYAANASAFPDYMPPNLAAVYSDNRAVRH